MNNHIRSIETLEGKATAYQVTDADMPGFDMVNAVKSHHADETGIDYQHLAGRKIAENKSKRHFVVVVVELDS